MDSLRKLADSIEAGKESVTGYAMVSIDGRGSGLRFNDYNRRDALELMGAIEVIKTEVMEAYLEQ